MKRIADDKTRVSQRLTRLYAPVRAELDEVEDQLRRAFSSADPFVDGIARHGLRLGGKRLRPALVLLSGKACGSLCAEHIEMAAAVELIHTASLLHDDVLDEAAMRRHLDTVNARWNNEASILLGDFLLAQAIDRVARTGSAFAMREIASAARIVCEGELRQVAWRGKFDLSEPEYLEIIADKTAALTASSCRLGAHFAGADDSLCERFACFGRLLGVAFQIVDDLLDVLGDEATVGKSLGTDLDKQKATLPLIRLLDQASPDDRRQVLALLENNSQRRGEEIRAWYGRYGALDYAHQKATQYTAEAARQIEGLTSTTATAMLQELADFVVARNE
jgi:octaprenyl-diphosphate synthase